MALMARAIGSVIWAKVVIMDDESEDGLTAIVVDGLGLMGVTLEVVIRLSEAVGVIIGIGCCRFVLSM